MTTRELTTKELLLHITRTAYRNDEMALLCGVFPWKWDTSQNDLVPDPERALTDDVARRETEYSSWTILKVLQHVAKCKAGYMVEAFGEPPVPLPPLGEDLESVLAYLEATQKLLVTCLESMDEADLGRPVPTSWHGETAGNLFWVMAQHDVDHGSQMVSLRKLVEHEKAGSGVSVEELLGKGIRIEYLQPMTVLSSGYEGCDHSDPRFA